jgi:hypothetical protein
MRRYYVILVRLGKGWRWEVYRGNRGDLDPSLFLTLKDAKSRQRSIRGMYPYRCTCVVQDHGADQDTAGRVRDGGDATTSSR